MTRSAKSAPKASKSPAVDIGDLSDLRLDYAPPPPRGPRGGVIAGLVGACVLGAGLGLWARPVAEERRQVQRPPAATAQTQAARQLQIVVDHSLALPDPALEAAPDPGPDLPPLAAPRRAPAGLMKVTAPAPVAEPQGLDVERLTPPPARAAATAPRPERTTKADANKAEPVPAKAAKAKLDKAKPPKAKVAKAKTETAKAKAAKSGRETARAAARKAKTEGSKSATAKADQPQTGKSKTAKAEKAKVEKARLDRLRGQRIAEARKADTARRLAQARVKPPPSPLRMTTTVSQVERCLDRDPGAALVCADPELAAQDRRMTRAYRSAQAAGVSEAELQRQHRRWLAARAAAAREAPWAVRDVYQARIAELDDLTREAGGDY